MKPVVCYAVAAMPFATPGSAAIADLLAIGSGNYGGQECIVFMTPLINNASPNCWRLVPGNLQGRGLDNL